MDPSEYKITYQVEGYHWWYLGMETITRALLKQYLNPDPNRRILDAGCGTGGAIANYLRDYGRVTGVDLSRIALGYCLLRHIEPLACASIEALPFASDSFDLITSFDVLYEQGVLSDSCVIAEFHRVLAAGGRLLLRLPAYDWLRGRHDVNIHTARRYVSPQVVHLLKESGFFVERVSYANMILFPAALIKRLTEKILPSGDGASDLRIEMGRFNGLLKTVLSLEAPLVVGTGLPFGLSIFAVGRKM